MMSRDNLYFKLLDMLDVTSPAPNDIVLMERFLPTGGKWVKDNYIYKVGNSDTLFACHIDTVGKEPMSTDPVYLDGKLYTGNKDVRCLGGDDRCGILCLLSLIDAGVPGTYIFHSAEERGAIGAHSLSLSYDFSQFKRAIEFDRRGTNSIITSMSGDRVCSNLFANELGKQLKLGYKSDPTGLFTDVFIYKYLIPEVTNLSVGYMHEHRNDEEIEVLWLIDDFIPAIAGVKWEELPVSRDHKHDELVELAYSRKLRYVGNSKYSNSYTSIYDSAFYASSNEYSRSFNLLNEEMSLDTKDDNEKSETKDLEKYDAFGECDICKNRDFLTICANDLGSDLLVCIDCVDEAKDSDLVGDCDLCGNTDFVIEHKEGLGETHMVCADCLEIIESMDEKADDVEDHAALSFEVQ